MDLPHPRVARAQAAKQEPPADSVQRQVLHARDVCLHEGFVPPLWGCGPEGQPHAAGAILRGRQVEDGLSDDREWPWSTPAAAAMS